jgi:sorbitol-specific phosphotransferase system component IIBC
MSRVSDFAGSGPEDRHRACWYGRRIPHWGGPLPVQTVEDGQLLYCAHPMMFPVVGYAFDVRNCEGCDGFRPLRSRRR